MPGRPHRWARQHGACAHGGANAWRTRIRRAAARAGDRGGRGAPRATRPDGARRSGPRSAAGRIANRSGGLRPAASPSTPACTAAGALTSRRGAVGQAARSPQDAALRCALRRPLAQVPAHRGSRISRRGHSHWPVVAEAHPAAPTSVREPGESRMTLLSGKAGCSGAV